MSGERPLTQKAISDRLGQLATVRTPEMKELEGASGAQSLSSLFTARSQPTVRRICNGETVPTRDVVFDLLRLVEAECGTPSPEAVQELWTLYQSALRERAPATYTRYVFMDAYVSVRLLVVSQQRSMTELQQKIEENESDQARSKARVRRLQRTLAVLRRTLKQAEGQQLQQQEDKDLLEQSVAELSAKVAALEQEVSQAQDSVAQWQEQAEWLQNLREQAERDAVLDSEAWGEREALLLERLSQAYETLEDVTVRAHGVEAALRAREERWQQQAKAAQAETRSVGSEADAARREAAAARAETEAVRAEAQSVREQAARALQEQQAQFEKFAAQAEERHQRARREAEHLKQELAQTNDRLRQAEEDAFRADAQLSELLRKQELHQAFNEIVAQAVDEHGRLSSRELPGFDTPPASKHMPSSAQSVLTPAAAGAVPAKERSASGDSRPSAPPPPSAGSPAADPPHRRTRSSDLNRLSKEQKLILKQRGMRKTHRHLYEPPRPRDDHDRLDLSWPVMMTFAVRAVALLIGLTACAFGVMRILDARTEEFPDLYKRPCASAPAPSAQHECTSKETGHVVAKNRTETSGQLTVVRKSGEKKTLAVEDDVYEAAKPGSTADLMIFDNRIAKISVAGKSDRIPPHNWLSIIWIALLIGTGTLGAALAVVGGRGTPWAAVSFLFGPFHVLWTGICSGVVVGVSSWWGVLVALLIWLPFALAQVGIVKKDEVWASSMMTGLRN
ncbi:hypothetical protein ACU639_36865 [Streptomyces cynarae]|uniref:hypothetical protein n=1 Tax=Streptomyces cynarae TaxID=2981134 RepID=UPI00406D25B5